MMNTRILSALMVAGIAACSGRVASTTDAGVAASGVTPLPACEKDPSMAQTAPACGRELTSCDASHPQGLPVGACTAGATCDVTVHSACACADESGPRFPWTCSCVSGEWRCELQPPDARTCTNACLDAGVDASSDGGGGGCPKPKAISPPGPRVVSRSAKGTGVCAAKTLGEVIDAVHAAVPALADIVTVYDPDKAFTDGSFIYAFATPGGFALAFKRGGGDCPAGCTENEWWYFSTDASCAPKQVGHYHPTFGSSCLMVDGSAMWATPLPYDPASICGSDTSAQDISGTYSICATGSHTACTAKAGAEPTTTFTGNYTLVVAQNPSDRSKGTVTVTGTGHPKIDGIPFDAKFMRRRFEATKTFSNLPAKCIDEWSLNVSLDFESLTTPGKLSFFESHSIDCSETTGGGGYCKGQISADLFAP